MHHTLTKLIALADEWISHYEEDSKKEKPQYSDFHK